jgi:hypothetical protein
MPQHLAGWHHKGGNQDTHPTRIYSCSRLAGLPGWAACVG